MSVIFPGQVEQGKKQKRGGYATLNTREAVMNAVLLLLCVVVTGLFPAIGFGADLVFRVKDRTVIPFQQMIEDLKKANVVFVGEIHNVTKHHSDQLAVIRAFHEADIPMAVGLEMFRADSQGTLDAWSRGRLSLDRFLPVYSDNWDTPWVLYRDIFLYIREHELPSIGLNIPDDLATKVAKRGFSSLSAAEKKILPPDISCSVDDKYMQFIRQAYAGHSRKDQTFLHFCEAQMVWDKSMAWHLLDYRKKHPDRTIVALAGVGHAWKRGIALQVEQESKLSIRTVLPYLPGQVDEHSITTRDADYVLFP
jgi:uncharacterized iron-regulated protein